jgi:hypothetical protein
MKRFLYLSIFGLLLSLSLFAQNPVFTQSEITDEIFSRIQGKSFPEECTTSRENLRFLRVSHYNGEGEVCQGELICHHSIAEDLLDIFRQLYDARYPIERMVLIDEYDADDEASMAHNNTSAFNFRYISGTRRLSKHSLGLAVDINPLYNPYVRQRGGKTLVSPSGAAPYADRSKDFPYKIDRNDLCYRLFKAHGFTWGGDWKSSKDYQHFEKKH